MKTSMRFVGFFYYFFYDTFILLCNNNNIIIIIIIIIIIMTFCSSQFIGYDFSSPRCVDVVLIHRRGGRQSVLNVRLHEVKARATTILWTF